MFLFLFVAGHWDICSEVYRRRCQACMVYYYTCHPSLVLVFCGEYQLPPAVVDRQGEVSQVFVAYYPKPVVFPVIIWGKGIGNIQITYALKMAILSLVTPQTLLMSTKNVPACETW